MGFDAKYDRDFYAWTQEQALRLREAAVTGTNLPLDWEHLAEEIESMGRGDRRGTVSHLARVIEHLLKLEHSPAGDPRRGWMLSVRNARKNAGKLLQDSPSLRAKIGELVEEAWADGRDEASHGLSHDSLPPEILPAACPYSADQLLDLGFWPVNRHGLE